MSGRALVRMTLFPDGREQGWDADGYECWIARSSIAMWWGRVEEGPPLTFSEHLAKRQPFEDDEETD